VKYLLAFIGGGLLVIAPVCLLFFGWYTADVYHDRKQKVIVTGPTPVFSTEECFGTNRQRIANVQAGEHVAVRRVIYEKECMTVRVRLKSGQEGYLVSGDGWRLQ